MNQSVHQYIAQTDAELEASFKRLDNELLSTAREIDAEIRAVLRETDPNGSHRAWAMGWARGFLTYATRGESQLEDLEELESVDDLQFEAVKGPAPRDAPLSQDDIDALLSGVRFDLKEPEAVPRPAKRDARRVFLRTKSTR